MNNLKKEVTQLAAQIKNHSKRRRVIRETLRRLERKGITTDGTQQADSERA